MTNFNWAAAAVLTLFTAVSFHPMRADPPASPALYEEDVLASSPIRLEQLQQMQAYIASLPENRPQGSSPEGGTGGSVSAGLRRDKPPAVGSKTVNTGGGSIGDMRQAFRDALGYPPPGFLAKGSARFVKVGEDGVANYFRCYVRVTPQMDTYGLYIVPKKAVRPAPLVIAMHGGGGFPELATFQGGSNYHDLVRGAVSEGYVVFAPLAVMYPYRDRDHGTPIPEDVREQLDGKLKLHGLRLMGVEVAKISRALDVLLARPEIDPGRVAMIGLSYGGFYTLYTAALDDRIGVAVASCSFRDRGPSDPAVAKRIEETAILHSRELVELISPRPLQVQDGIKDEIFPIEDVRRAVAASRAFYPGPLAARFDFEEFDGPHEFCGRVAWPFLRKYLK